MCWRMGHRTRRRAITEAPIWEARSSAAVMGYCARYAIASRAPRRSSPAASRLRQWAYASFVMSLTSQRLPTHCNLLISPDE